MSTANAFFGETYREKAARKFRENPFVPVGMLSSCLRRTQFISVRGATATTAALIVAMVKMRRGQSRSFNNWLRVRVLAQGVTICAVVLGTYSLGRRAVGGDPVEVDLQRRKEEKMERDRLAFEERLKSAVEVHDERSVVAKDGMTASDTRGVTEEKGRSDIPQRRT